MFSDRCITHAGEEVAKLFRLGMGEFDEAKKTYAELRTKYGDSKSERVRGMVKAADAAYFKVREKK